MALSHSWHIGIDVPPPPRSEQASQETIPTETIFSASLPVPAELSSLDCSSCCCANRALEVLLVELDREIESRRGRVRAKSDVLVATDPFFFSMLLLLLLLLREKREFAVGL